MNLRRIYKVTGDDANGGERTVYIESASEAVARNAAIRVGLVNTRELQVVTRDEINAAETIIDAARLLSSPDRAAPTPLRDLKDSKLFTNPVGTIAWGMFFGWLMIVVFSLVVAFILNLLGIAFRG